MSAKFNGKIISSVSDTASYIERILQGTQSRYMISGTSKTAYRHVHEVIASSLDRLSEFARQYRGREQEARKNIGEHMLRISKGLILVRYQMARKQLGANLGQNLAQLIQAVLGKVREFAAGRIGLDELATAIENARSILDAWAVIVYQFAR